ncbi:uncharacterized protein LOC143291368 [Babylonia areolata]|uniref:uncharacterized protein LOC143291368 n=1 Tax=Babylonia areolata TaxID=304850 RepID=UPI003FD58A87
MSGKKKKKKKNNNNNNRKNPCSAPPVNVSTTAYVTCHFTTDVTRLRPVSISVEFLPDGAPYSKKIAYCDLSERSTSCSEAGPGSRFSLSPVDTAHRDWSLEIPDVKVQDQGQYYCQLLSDKAGEDDFVPCSLAVGGTYDTVSTVSTPPSVAPDSGSDEKRDGGPSVLAIVGGIVGGVVIVGVGCLVYRRRCICQRGQSPEMPMEENGRGVGEPEAREQRDEHEAGGEHGSSGPSSLQQTESRAGAGTERIRQRGQSPEMPMDEHEAGGEHGNTEEEPEETPEEEEEKEPLLLQGPTGGDEDENAEDEDLNV